MRSFLFLLAFVTLACKSQVDRTPAIGQAYAGPAKLILRQEINPKSAAVATAPHGERLDILQQRRRFVKVRTAKGEEGWTEERMLLTSNEVARLARFNQQARTMPTQGSATTYSALNVHTEPSRSSPSFVQLKTGEKFDVIGHEMAPRRAPPRKSLVVAAPKPVLVKKPGKAPKIPQPLPPAPPKPPDDWRELSKTNLPEDPEENVNEPEPADDWSLVRTATGQSGWVLTRSVFMSIPDEVAQYAEGRRITAYFPLGDIRDGDQVKKIWLWTTVEQSLTPYDYDSYRVFIWSLRRHRYETAYIQRRMKGHFPVLVEQPGFSVCVEGPEGTRIRRIYSLTGNLVRPAGQKPCEVVGQERPDSSATLMAQSRAEAPEQASDSFYTRVKDRLRTWRKRWLNR